MAAIEPRLFDWRDVAARRDWDRFYWAGDHLLEARWVSYLKVRRGAGRDDYPVAARWNALIAGVVFPHPSSAARRRARGRTPALRQAGGCAVLPIQRQPVTPWGRDAATGRLQAVSEAAAAPRAAGPTRWSFSRLLANVIAL